MWLEKDKVITAGKRKGNGDRSAVYSCLPILDFGCGCWK